MRILNQIAIVGALGLTSCPKNNSSIETTLERGLESRLNIELKKEYSQRFSEKDISCLEEAQIHAKRANQYPEQFSGCEIVEIEYAHGSPRKAKAYPEVFNGYDIAYFITQNIKPHASGFYTNIAGYLKLLSLEKQTDWSQEPQPLFNYFDIERMQDVGCTVDYIWELASIIDNTGNPRFSGHEIAQFCSPGTVDDKGNKLTFPINFVKTVAAITDENGESLYSMVDIFDLRQLGAEDSGEEVRLLATLKDSEGNLLFDRSQELNFAGLILKFLDLPVYGDDTKRIRDVLSIREQLTDFELRRYLQLGVTKEEILEFQDTEKPNAVIVYPTMDNYAFETYASRGHFRKIRQAYDTWVTFATTEDEAYQAIEKVPNIELLVLSGHGTFRGMHLGNNNVIEEMLDILSISDTVGDPQTITELEKAKEAEKYFIDMWDTELSDYLKKLSPDATIFLNGCSVAQGGKWHPNLANFVSKAADGRRVIAVTREWDSILLRITSLYPFDAEIMYTIPGLPDLYNATYTNKPLEQKDAQ